MTAGYSPRAKYSGTMQKIAEVTRTPMAPLLRHALLAAAFLFACDSSKPSPAQSGGNVAPAEPVKSSGPSAAGAAETYNLRGAPVKGATRRAELDLTMTDAQMTFKAGPLSFSGVMTLHVQSSDDLEILEAGDGQVRKGRLNHVLDKSTMSMRMTMPDGTVETENGDENGPLHGIPAWTVSEFNAWLLIDVCASSASINALRSSVRRSGELANCSLVLFVACCTSLEDSRSLPMMTWLT